MSRPAPAARGVRPYLCFLCLRADPPATALACADGIMSLWPMNKQTGATVIVPRSHSPENVAHIQSYREKHNVDWDAMSESEQRNFTEHFTSIGLQPGILNAAAGDLCFFDTALYHGVCHGADPLANGECDHRPPLHAPTRCMMAWAVFVAVAIWCFGGGGGWRVHLNRDSFGPNTHHCAGPDQLLRAIFIQSMVPSRLLGRGHGEDDPPLGSSHRSDVLRCVQLCQNLIAHSRILLAIRISYDSSTFGGTHVRKWWRRRARRIAYEKGIVTGGSIVSVGHVTCPPPAPLSFGAIYCVSVNAADQPSGGAADLGAARPVSPRKLR